MNERVLVETEDLSRDEWLDYRQQGLGGSDMPVVVGVSQYKSPFELYLEKRDEVEREDIDNRFMKAGRYLEDPIAEWTAERHNLNIRNRYAIFQHPDRDWHLANIDKEILGGDLGRGILEIKNQGTWRESDWFDDGDEAIPIEVLLQVSHYLALPWYHYAYIGCLIGGNKLITRYLEPDEELIADMAEIGAEFWRKVEEGIEPELDGSDSTRDAVADKYEVDEDREVVLTGSEKQEISQLIQQYDRITDDLDELEEDKKRIQNELMDRAGERKKLIVEDGDQTRSVVQVSTSRSYLDKSAVLENHPEIQNDEAYWNESESRYVRIY